MALPKHELEYPEELQALLENLLGSRNVYFQPPSDKKLSYPCIVYQLDYIRSIFADSIPYNNTKRYTVTYIDKSPDQYIPDKIGQLQFCSFSRFYVADNLNHYSYRLYFEAEPNNNPRDLINIL